MEDGDKVRRTEVTSFEKLFFETPLQILDCAAPATVSQATASSAHRDP
jgi:hypothetical protein